MQLVESNETITAAFSPKVKDNIRIRRRQLVAIDTSTSPPEIAWRWFIGEVESVHESGVAVRRLDQPPGSCRVVSNPVLGLTVEPGSEVYYGHPGDWEVAGLVAGNRPADPAAIAERYFPLISAQLA